MSKHMLAHNITLAQAPGNPVPVTVHCSKPDPVNMALKER